MTRNDTKPVIGCCLAILATANGLASAVAQDGDRTARAFQQLDRDGDGRITPRELPIPRAFEALDGNADGVITAAEPRAAVAEMTPENRQKLAAIRRAVGGDDARPGDAPEATGHRASYYMNGEIHINELGTPEEEPLTTGHWDFKPSWSKTGDMLVFFHRLKNDRNVGKWKTAICIINVDGTGFQQLTDGTHTDFNQTWTRDGTNTPIWNRKNLETGGRTRASRGHCAVPFLSKSSTGITSPGHQGRTAMRQTGGLSQAFGRN
jgi:hypothetical protein